MKRLNHFFAVLLMTFCLALGVMPVQAATLTNNFEGGVSSQEGNQPDQEKTDTKAERPKFTAYHFISAGSSDAILVESDGHFGLIDASNPSNSRHPQYNSSIYNGEKVVDYMTKAGVTHLDFVLATHSHSDHIGGIPAVARATIDGKPIVDQNTVYYYKHYTGTTDTQEQSWDNSDYYSDALNAMTDAGAILVDVNAPDANSLNRANAQKYGDRIRFKMGDLNLTLYNLGIVAAGGENENTICLLAEYKGTRTLFLGDLIPRQGNEKLVTDEVFEDGGTVNAIKVAHHGYENATTAYMLDKLNPRYLFVENNFITPSPWYTLWAYPHNTETYWSGQDSEGIVAFPSSDRYQVTTSEAYFGLFSIGSTNTGSLPAVAQTYLQFAANPNNNLMANRWIRWIDGSKISPMHDINGISGPGWYDEGCYFWYYTDENGYYIRNQFRLINGKWYYFDAQGHMLTGWQNINGYYYYFDGGGAMLASQFVDGYWLSADGTWTYPYRASWRLNSVGWWYGDDSGWYARNQWETINGVDYYFDNNGYMLANKYIQGCWLGADGGWRYPYRASWRLNYKGWWYGDATGWYARNQWESIDGVYYYFDDDGYMLANKYIQGYWLSADGAWRYPYRASWHLNSRGWWYGDETGWYARNQWESIDGVYYYFDRNGYMVTNQYIGGYWLGASGAWTYPDVASWHLDSNGWWYGDSTGWYARNEQLRIDGITYQFDARGYML